MDTHWYEDDTFWLTFAPVMFEEGRWAAAAEEARAAAGMLGLSSGSRLMDSCSGVGRHSLEFARMGLRVTAVDRTSAYIDAARDSAEADGVEIEFIHADVREFVREGGFDGIVNLFTSFGYFETLEEELTVLRNYRASLRPGGRLIIDVIGKELLAKNFTPFEWYEYDGMYVLAHYAVQDNWNRLFNRWILYRDGERFEYSFSHRVFSAEELTGLLNTAGFTTIGVYGDINGIPYDLNADRLVVCAEK
jgi:cyclopropane fatty-acyl-phospholipid synthase-like methyltransferase